MPQMLAWQGLYTHVLGLLSLTGIHGHLNLHAYVFANAAHGKKAAEILSLRHLRGFKMCLLQCPHFFSNSTSILHLLQSNSFFLQWDFRTLQAFCKLLICCNQQLDHFHGILWRASMMAGADGRSWGLALMHLSTRSAISWGQCLRLGSMHARVSHMLNIHKLIDVRTVMSFCQCRSDCHS